MEKVKKKHNFFKRFFNNFLFLYFVAVFLSKILKYILFSYYLIIILTSKIIKISNFIYYNIYNIRIKPKKLFVCNIILKQKYFVKFFTTIKIKNFNDILHL